MKKIFYSVLAITLLLVTRSNAQVWEIPNSVISAGATLASDAQVRIQGTVGQPIIGIVNNTYQIDYQGFWFVYKTKSLWPLSVEEEKGQTTNSKFLTLRNYPNPFSSQTTLEFNLPSNGIVNLKLYNSLGREVKSLVTGFRQAGLIKVHITSDELESGQYVAVLNANGATERVNVVVVK